MSDAKTYVFGNEGNQNGMLGLIAPLLQQRGLDPNMVMAMMNNKNGFGSEGGWFIWVIFLFFLMGWGNNGWGNNKDAGGNLPLANFLNNDNGRELLMSAIQGNATSISQLATTLNCDVNAIQTAINGVSALTSQVGNQVGLTGQQVVNAIQQGNMGIAQQLASCCCDVRTAVTTQGYESRINNLNQTNQLQQAINNVATAQSQGFNQLGYASQQQTCDLQNTINQGVQKIVDGQNAAELRELNSKLASQAEELSTFKTANIIAQQLTPINASIAALQGQVNEIKCAQPQTVTLPYSCATAVPTALAQYLYGSVLKNAVAAASTTTTA